MSKTYSITVRGTSGKTYGFMFTGESEHVQGWEDEGFEINEVLYCIPVWVVNLHLGRAWMFMHDFFAFRWSNIFKILKRTPDA